jgi:hypothetical protein
MLSFEEEEQRLLGTALSPAPQRLVLTLAGISAKDSASVLAQIKNVLRTVVAVRAGGVDWPSTEEWARRLPRWFVEGCAPERTQAEIEEWLKFWRALPPLKRAAASEERAWTLSGWLHWFAPGGDERQWRWLDAGVEGDHRLWITIEVAGYPTAYGALRWLLRAAAVTNIDER